MFSIVSEDSLVGSYKHKSKATERARTFTNFKGKKHYIVQIIGEINPGKGVEDLFFKISDLEPHQVYDLRGNRKETIFLRSLYTFIRARIAGESHVSVAKRLRLYYGTLPRYLKNVEEYIESEKWMYTKWRPLIKHIIKYHPESLQK